MKWIAAAVVVAGGLGAAITPVHLWRVPWIAPLGIAGGVLADMLLGRWRLAQTAAVALQVLLLLSVLGAGLVLGWLLATLGRLRRGG